MKTKESQFFIDKIIVKHQSLSKKEKLIINLIFRGLLVFLVLSIIGKIYDGGEVFGNFLYKVNH